MGQSGSIEMAPVPDLYQCFANDVNLNTFIDSYLQPNVNFRNQVNAAVDTICEFLRENCYRGHRSGIKVLKVVKGGSSAKGTALKEGSDADLVVFLNCIQSYSDQESNRKEIIAEIREKLEECKRQKSFEVTIEKSKWENPRVLSFRMRSKRVAEFIDFDVLPAYNALGQVTSGYKVKPDIYLNLINNWSPGKNYSSCFTELQRDFIVSRPTKVKSLVRLVKHWYKTKLKGLKDLPPKYAFELLSIYAWEQMKGGGQDRFNMAEAFRNFLELICNYQDLCVYWTKNYNFEDNNELAKFLRAQIRNRPVILDPADPTGNLAEGYKWAPVAIEAENCLSQMHTKTSGSPILFRELKHTLPDSVINNNRIRDIEPPQEPQEESSGAASCDSDLHSGTVSSTCESIEMATVPDLYQCPANNLDKFIFEHLQPNEEFLTQVRAAVDTICKFLRENCYRGHPSGNKVLKVVKGGSTAKGTALKGDSNADLVVFLNCIQSYSDQVTKRSEIIEEIIKNLEECKRQNIFDVIIEKSRWENPRVLSCRIRLKNDFVECDILPAYDALGQLTSGYTPPPEIYVNLFKNKPQGENFASCFTELQRDFIVSRPTKVKSLIRLVKHWYKTKLTGKKLPPKYAFELLSIYAWEEMEGGRQDKFNMAQAFRNFLELICNYQDLCVCWTKNYNFEDNELARFLRAQLAKDRPVILDPADPTGNLGESGNWELVAIEAERCLSQMCYKTSADHRTPFRDLKPTLPDSLINKNRSTNIAPREYDPPIFAKPSSSQPCSPPQPQEESSWFRCTII